MKIIKVILIVLLFLMIVPRNVQAEEFGRAYFYYIDNTDECLEKYYEYDLSDFETIDEKSYFILNKLFENNMNDITYVPNDTEIISTKVENGLCIININKEGFFTGGRYSEDKFINQLLKTVWSLNGINSIIIYVEGVESNLSGGIDFSVYKNCNNGF